MLLSAKIPLMYRIAAKNISDKSIYGKISLRKAREIMRVIHRMPEESICHIFAEMKKMGLIIINGQRFINLLVDEEDLELF